MIIQRKKILIILLISIIIIFLGFLGYKYYTDSEPKSLHIEPIIYTLDFSTKTINTDIPPQYLDFDPIFVGIQITGVKSENVKGITIFERPASDINRVLESRHTVGFADSGYYFPIPNMTAEYLFDVKIEYYDGNIINSSDYFSGPILTIRPELNKGGGKDEAIITLKTNKTHVSIGEGISFEVISKSQFDNEQYQKNQSILWDFDGDDINDIGTINKIQTHKYLQTGIYRPKVTVLYNGKPSIAYGDNIYVQ